MGYGSYIGYVGALAVALGVGAAVATTPGVAFALPAESGSPSPSTGDSSPTTTDGDAAPADEVGGTDAPPSGPDLPSGSADVSSLTVADGDDAPELMKRSSRRPMLITTTPRNLVSLRMWGPAVKKVQTVPPVAAPQAQDDASVQHLVSGVSSDGLEFRKTTRASGQRALSHSVAVGDTDQPVAAAAGQSAQVGGQQMPALRLAAVTDAPARYSSVVPTATAAVASLPPVPDLGDVLEEPHTVLVGVVAHAAHAVLDVFLAPLGPTTPAQSPMLWTVLAFVRNEFERTLIPQAAPGTTTSGPGQSPNLLLNPGAEAGDPSLSGYAAVSLPGWQVTGTPTAIKYGTERRFPVPTATPGPVLPGLLAFPSSDGTIPTPAEGQQFFGGGPVADSTLTQTVDLSAAQELIDAGDGTYTLSGDLGGFLIDPSRTTVTVNFLDENGQKLGTGTLEPVTAWDRLFTTGFIHRTASGTVPQNTRTAQVVVILDDRNPVLGNYNNAYADNLSFTVNDPGLTPTTLAPPASNVGHLDHVFMVYLENKGVDQIVGSPNAPYINELINNYGYASNYYGLTHPSDPNYYPIVGGSDFGFNYNCPSNCFPAGTPNLADSIENAGMTWAGYMEGGGGYSTPTDRLPFLAFSDIYNDPDRVAAHLFDISRLEQDLENPDTTPNFVWFAADDATNMEGPTDFPVGIFHWALGFLSPAHQYNVKAGDEWLEDQITTITSSPTWNDPNVESAIFVTFDEDYNNITTGVGNEGNHIVMVVIPSPGALYDPVTNPDGMRAGAFVADDHYNHYSLQRTIEESLDIDPLTNNDAYAQPMNEFWVCDELCQRSGV